MNNLGLLGACIGVAIAIIIGVMVVIPVAELQAYNFTLTECNNNNGTFYDFSNVTNHTNTITNSTDRYQCILKNGTQYRPIMTGI